jgi:hypothetical protein
MVVGLIRTSFGSDIVDCAKAEVRVDQTSKVLVGNGLETEYEAMG